MSSSNPLIFAPHVPPQTSTPKWGDFLDSSFKTDRPPGQNTRQQLQNNNRQLHPISWYQVKDAQQPVWSMQPAAQQQLQGHLPGNSSYAETPVIVPKRSSVTSRWRQQLQPGVQPSPQLQPGLTAGTTMHQNESEPGSWVERKRAQQKAAAKSAGRSGAQAGIEQEEQQEYLQPRVSLQHQQPQPQPGQPSHSAAEPRCGAGSATAAVQGQQRLRQELQQQQHHRPQQWLLDDDVQLPEDDNLLWSDFEPQQQPLRVQQPRQHFIAPQQQPLGLQEHQQQPTNLQQQRCVQQGVQQQVLLSEAERYQYVRQQPHLNLVTVQHQRHGPQQQPQQQQQQPKQGPSWDAMGQHLQQQFPLCLATRTVNAEVANKWVAGAAMASAQPLKVAKAPGTLPAAVRAVAGAGDGSRDVAAAAPNSKRGRGPGNKGRGGCDAGGRGSHGGKDTKGAKTASNITSDFIPKPKGSGSSSEKDKQDRMHQETIHQTLERARKNQLQAEGQQPQQQDKLIGAGKAGKAAAASRRKRASNAAAEGEGEAADTAGPSGGNAGSAVAGGSSSGTGQGSNRAKKRRRPSAQAAGAADDLLQEAVETLDLWVLDSNSSNAGHGVTARCDVSDATHKSCRTTGMVHLNSHAAWQQLQTDLLAAAGVALGLLMCQRAGQAVQYCSSLQQLSKEQHMLLKKHTKATSKAAAASSISDSAESCVVGPSEVVGFAVMPVTTAQTPGQAVSTGNSSSFSMYYCRVAATDEAPTQQQQLSPEAVQLLSELLSSRSCCPCVCSNAKAVLCSLAGLGVSIPAAGSVSLVDPEVLGWLADPQLVQDCKQAGCYTLQAQLERLGLQQELSVASSTSQSSGPLHRLRQQMQQSVRLADFLLNRLKDSIAGAAIKLEMQVTAVLARMELAGVGISPQYLLDHKATLHQRIAAISNQAAAYAGRPFNLSSASQLAAILYDDLKLPPPAAGGGRGSAKTHLPTDEQTLKQLASMHPLPGFIIEYRCMQNVITKWMDPEWVQEATRHAVAAGCGTADVHCSWNQLATATGRLSSSSPNLQAVTKYTITAYQQAQAATSSPAPGPCVLSINIRDAFVARPGTLLLSADYSQIELRLLAHFSGDPLLRQLLHQTGSQGDVFKLIAAAWMQPGAKPGSGDVDAATRERAKRVVYGIIYGLSAYGLSQQLAEQGLTVDGAEALIRSFLNRFQGVRQFMSTCLQSAQSTGSVKTLMQRTRLIAGLAASNHKDKAAAERKVVNSIVQGSAADLIKLAMRDWDDWAVTTADDNQDGDVTPHTAQQRTNSESKAGGARLIAQIHDELLFEVDASDAVIAADGSILSPGAKVQRVAQVVQNIMAMERLQLSVPLKVNMSWGQRWGSMQSLE